MEYIRSTKASISMEIDTNKATYNEIFHMDDSECFEEFLDRAQKWWDSTNEGI